MHPEATSSLVSFLKSQDICAYPCLRVTLLEVGEKKLQADECEVGGLDNEKSSEVLSPSVGSILS